MDEIIKHLLEGNLFIVYIIIIVPIVISLIKKKHNENPRLKLLPYYFGCILFLVLIPNYFKLISIQCTWISIFILLIIYLYLFLVRTTIKASCESLLLKKVLKKINNNDIDCFESFYFKYKKYFISCVGKYSFYMNYLIFISNIGISSLCFEILDDIQKLKLTNKEKRKFYLLEFEIYNKAGAIRNWEDKYEIDKICFDDKDKLYVSSILSFQKLDLVNAEKGFRKLLSRSDSSNYKYIAENNLGVIEEYRGNTFFCNDYIQKAYRTNETIKADKHSIRPNLISNYLYNNKTSQANDEFVNYIESLPNKTIEQRILIENEKLNFHRQTSNIEEIKKSIFNLFEEYKKAPESKKYCLLISLFRITYNHNILFEELLKELEDKLDNILLEDFRTIKILCEEILGIAKIINEISYKERVFNITEKGFNRLREFDYDIESSKLKPQEVNLKRSFILFKMELVGFDSFINNVEEHENFLYTRLKILDELISFDKENLYTFNQLNSLLIKLDEITNAIVYFKTYHQLLENSKEILNLVIEAKKLIPQIELILSKAPNAKPMAQYHLQLAYHYCILNNNEKGYLYFQKFKESKVSLDNYANWLKEFYNRLENHFGDE